jgi:hypothetical protein
MDFSSNFSYQFYELILGKSEDILRRDEEMLFKVSILRPSNGLTFRAIVNAEVVDMSRKNRFILTLYS